MCKQFFLIVVITTRWYLTISNTGVIKKIIIIIINNKEEEEIKLCGVRPQVHASIGRMNVTSALYTSAIDINT